MSAALEAARQALGDAPAWLVGGAVRDRLMGRAVVDVDLVVAGDVARAAKHLAVDAGGPAFPLSEAFGAWRVIGPDRSWQIDVSPLHEGSLDADLARRDFTVNAIAEPLSGGELVDPHDGAGDVAARRLRMVSAGAFASDPLRVLRLARLACELGLEPEADTVAAARSAAPGLTGTAAERVFAELKRILVADRVLDGLELAEQIGATAVVLPELDALSGVGQNRFHHLDVHDHTLAVVQAAADLQADPAPLVGDELAAAVTQTLAEPFSDELTRGGALRVGALLHDIAKPQTQLRHQDGTVLGFPRHDSEGAEQSRAILARLRASEKLRAHAAGLARHHLRAGFLVHERPLSRRAIFDYLRATAPVAIDVTLLSLADRVATRGDNAHKAIEGHVDVARTLLAAALEQEAAGPQAPLVRGDVLAAELGIAPGPELGPLLAEIEAARYAGEVTTPGEAVAHARQLRQ